MNALQFFNSLRPALPFSAERTVDADGKCVQMSNGELRRQMTQGAVLINGERLVWDEPIDFPVFSLVFYPKSSTRRCTLV